MQRISRITFGNHTLHFPAHFNPMVAKGIRFLQRHWYSLTIFVTFFIFFFVLYFYNQRQTSLLIYWFDDWIFYADSGG